MVQTDTFDLSTLQLSPGGGRRLALRVAVDAFSFGGERYCVSADAVAARVEISRMTGDGYALKLQFAATLEGPCMRCLEPAAPVIEVEAREVSQPGGGEELDSPYLKRGVLDLRAWVRDALALSIPAQLLCDRECAGLCAVCGANLNLAGPEHQHARPPDPRWAKLSQVRLE